MKAKNTNKADVAPAQSGQHTPGPQQALRELIEAAKSWGYGNTEVVQNAKSALKYKSAPELLEALNACLNAAPSLDYTEAGSKARAAIAKAEGNGQ